MRLAGFAEGTVFFQHATSQETVEFEKIDTVVLSFGGVPDTRLEHALSAYQGDIHVIGDCLAPRTAEEAILEGVATAAQL